MAATPKKKMQNLNKTIDWSKQFEKVSKYAYAKYGFDVLIKDGEDYAKIDFANFLITIKPIYNHKENMTYLLLHELGHVIQTKSKTYKRRVIEVVDVVSKSSLSFRTTMLYEEMDAWNEAYDLAKKLRIPLDRKKFETYKSRCLKTYMIWVLGTNQKNQNKQAFKTEYALESICENENIHDNNTTNNHKKENNQQSIKYEII